MDDRPPRDRTSVIAPTRRLPIADRQRRRAAYCTDIVLRRGRCTDEQAREHGRTGRRSPSEGPQVRAGGPTTDPKETTLPFDLTTPSPTAALTERISRRGFVAGLGALAALGATSRTIGTAAVGPVRPVTPLPGGRTPAPVSLWPAVVPRSVWDPEDRLLPADPPELSSSVERVFVHHTAVFPRYAAEDSASLVSRICRQHMEERGFSDIAYNFLIDRYGVVFQGRAGGILRPVVGAHAVGFNQRSAGIALLGDFETDEVPAATAEALIRLTAWLCLWHGIDPLGRSSQLSTGGATTRYAEGREIDLPTILGHRETGKGTPCPGRHMFAEIGSGRLASAVAATMGQAGASAPRRGPLPAA